MSARAIRFVDVKSSDVDLYFHQVEMDATLENKLAEQVERENYFLELEFGKHSRTRWLMTNEGLSLIEACEKVREEEEAWRKDTFEWLNDPKNQESEIYSDVYKDFYGVRPRW